MRGSVFAGHSMVRKLSVGQITIHTNRIYCFLNQRNNPLSAPGFYSFTILVWNYVNDLPAVTVSSDLDSYIDDSKLHLAFLVEDVQQTIAKLENDIYKTAKWCLEHQLLINLDKTKFLLVGTRSMLQNLPTQINLNFLGKTLKPVSVVKDLGMHLDLHLEFSRVKESFDKKKL